MSYQALVCGNTLTTLDFIEPREVVSTYPLFIDSWVPSPISPPGDPLLTIELSNSLAVHRLQELYIIAQPWPARGPGRDNHKATEQPCGNPAASTPNLA